MVITQKSTIKNESLIPDSPVIWGTLMKSKTPKIFYMTGRKTPGIVPYLFKNLKNIKKIRFFIYK